MNKKIMIDICMTVLLILLMAFQITGEMLHEVIGTCIGILFILHNVLNIRWYKSLLKGKYRLIRVIHTIVNILLLISMVLTIYSGIILSRNVFSFLNITNGMALARVIHLSSSYWSFVFVSLHLGLHWGMMQGMLKKMLSKKSMKVLGVLTIIIACYGAFCFWQQNIVSYLFLQVEFAFLDYETHPILILFQYCAMMIFWVYITHVCSRFIIKKR